MVVDVLVNNLLMEAISKQTMQTDIAVVDENFLGKLPDLYHFASLSSEYRDKQSVLLLHIGDEGSLFFLRAAPFLSRSVSAHVAQ